MNVMSVATSTEGVDLLNSRLDAHADTNRLKDILDGLQGRAGGPKNKGMLEPIIPNDRQIYRVIMEKEK